VKRDLLDPAINGTLSVLESAAKSSSVKRIVLTSSAVAVIDLTNPNPSHEYTENDWNPFTYEGAIATKSPHVAYFASKKLAEKAAWDFIEKQKPSFDLVTLCPPYIFGPFVHHVDKPDDLNESSKIIYDITHTRTDVDPNSGVVVDVRDIADAHLSAFENPKAKNQRYVVSAGTFDWQELVDIVHKSFPGKTKTAVGTPGKKAGRLTLNSTKVQKELGVTLRSFEETINDTVNQFINWKPQGK